MRTWIIAMFFMCACDIDPLDYYDFTTAGAQVKTNGFRISPHMVEYEIMLVQDLINEQPQFDFNPLVMSYLAEEFGLVIEYTAPPRPYGYNENGEVVFARGMYWDTLNIIQVHYPLSFINEPAETQCQELYYVLGHELLHFIAYKYLGSRAEQNHNHTVMINSELSLFFSLDFVSIEYDLWVETARTCGFIDW